MASAITSSLVSAPVFSPLANTERRSFSSTGRSTFWATNGDRYSISSLIPSVRGCIRSASPLPMKRSFSAMERMNFRSSKGMPII